MNQTKQMVRLIDTFQPEYLPKTDYMYNGYYVPRVTAILNRCIHTDSLMQWANSLGFKRQSYTKTLEAAASIGTECHESIELFLSGKETDIITNSSSMYAYESFLKWWKLLHKYYNITVLLHEESLVCNYFGGTLDGLYQINGKYYLVDYKTSNHITFKYCLQLAAYRYLLRILKGIEIDGCIILQLSKNDIDYTEYILNFCNPNHLQFMIDCEQAFLSLVYAYYNIYKIEGNYKKIDWGDNYN